VQNVRTSYDRSSNNQLISDQSNAKNGSNLTINQEFKTLRDKNSSSAPFK